MKNKLGIFTALILSLIIAGSVFASPGTVSAKKLSVAAKAKVSKTANTKKKRHRRHKRKSMKKTTAPKPTPKKS